MKLFSIRRTAPLVPSAEAASESPASGSRSGLHLRRNIVIMLIDAVGWPLGQSFLSPQTILPLFIALLSGSPFVIGLVVTAQSVCQLVPQLLIANRLEHMPVKRIYVVVVGVLLERLPYIALAAVVLLVASHSTVLLIFFGLWIVANVGTGINMPAFIGMYAKAIPAELRGRVGGLGNSAGTLIAVLGAYATTVILHYLPGMVGFSRIFVIGFAILLASVLPLAWTDEPPSEINRTRTATLDYLREIPRLLRGNRQFAGYVAFQAAIQLPLSAIPFITAYAVLKLHVTTSTIGLFTGVLMGATSIGSLLFGLLADRRGYRRVFVVTTVFAVLSYAILTFLPSLPLVYLSFFLAGLLSSTQFMGNNMAMEFCPPGRAGTFTAIVSTASAPVKVVGPLVLGLLAARVGMISVFLLVTIAGLVALYLILFRVSDPRFARVR